jgi:hypothetical protein
MSCLTLPRLKRCRSSETQTYVPVPSCCRSMTCSNTNISSYGCEQVHRHTYTYDVQVGYGHTGTNHLPGARVLSEKCPAVVDDVWCHRNRLQDTTDLNMVGVKRFDQLQTISTLQ